MTKEKDNLIIFPKIKKNTPQKIIDADFDLLMENLLGE